MSNPTTHYRVGGIDLSNIFQPHSGDSASITGYKISNGADLNTVFAPYSGGTTASATGYKVNGSDLNSIFAKYILTQTFNVSLSNSINNGNWTSISSDASGQLVSAISGANIYKSINYGLDWTNIHTSPANMIDVAVSSDGTIICGVYNSGVNAYMIWYNVATGVTTTSPIVEYNSSYTAVTIANNKSIYTLTSSGIIILYSPTSYTSTFTYNAHPFNGYDITSAANNNHLLMTTNSSTIYKSTNNGQTITPLTSITTPSTNIASDASGQYLAVTSKFNGLYTSNNSGTSWTRRFTDTQSWQAIASSSNGAVLIAGINASGSATGTVYISTDYGVTWTNQIFFNGVLFVSQVSGVSMSGDGTRFTVAAYGGSIYYGATISIWTWTPTDASNNDWSSIASDSTGTNLVATVGLGGIYTSTNSGANWIQQTAGLPINPKWSSIASSSNGQYLAALIETGTEPSSLYRSTTYGANWRPGDLILPTGANWYSIASSSDGQYLAAAAAGDYIYTSIDFGENWSSNSNSSGSKVWQAIASDSTGSKLAAVVYTGFIYTSTDSGANWGKSDDAPSANWWSIASSSDGIKLAAVIQNGGIYISSNSGINWSPTNAPNNNWTSITSSSDGTKLAATVYPGYIWSSLDSGATWSSNSNSSGSRQWQAIASSSDGTKLAAVVNIGGIYRGTYA